MTLCVVLFLFRRAGRYMYVCLTAFAVFAAFAYVPSLEPERLAAPSASPNPSDGSATTGV